MSTESAFVAAATAAVFSPRTRETLRRGAVYGIAGALKVGDVVTGAARGAVRGVRGNETMASDAASNGRGEAAPAAAPSAAAASTAAPSAAAPSTAAPDTDAPAGPRSTRPRRSTGTSASARRAAATAKTGGDTPEP